MRTPDSRHERLDQFVDDPRRSLWVLSLPIMIGMSIQTLYMVVDMVFVGRISGGALTALAFNMPLVFLAMGATFGLGTGVTACIAQAVGARSPQEATRVAQHALAVTGVMAGAFMVPGWLYGPEMLTALGVTPDLLGDSWSYLRIIVFGFPFMVSAVFLRSILSGEGEVKTPVMIQAGATLLNVILDPIFIFSLEMGVAGAALATIVAQALAAAALAVLVPRRRNTFVQLQLRGFRVHRATVARIIAVGAPASLSFMVMSVGGAAYNRLLVGFTPAAVAAHQVGMRLDHVVVLPMVAISSSLVTLVGMFYGARRPDLVYDIVRYAMIRAVLIGATLSVVMYAAAPWVVSIFSEDPAIRELGVTYVHIVTFSYPFMPISMLTGRILQGLGRGVPLLVLTCMRVLLIGVPLAAILVFVLHLPVHFVWVSVVAGSVCTAALAATWLWVAMRRVQRQSVAAH